MKGYLLVLDGIDGCGKTSQINHLSNWLPVSGLMPTGAKLHVTKEPGGTNLGNSLRKLLLNTSNENAPESTTELLLYAADRAQHVSQLIRPALEQGDWVLSDRFSGSTIAYQGYGRKLNMDIIEKLEAIATQGVSADITLWLKIGVEESLRRRKENKNDRIEAEGKDFLEKVSLGFEALAEKRNWITIYADQEARLVSQHIENALQNYLKPLLVS